MKKVHIGYEIAGWYGTAAIILAFALISYEIIGPGILYQFLNITGAIGVGLISWKKKVWQLVGLQTVWGLVGIAALVRILFF